MKRIISTATAAGIAVIAALLLLPLLVATVVVSDLAQASQVAAGWDIPPAVVPALQEAGAESGVSWLLLAGVASVATDFARHGPDGIERGDTTGTAIYPVVTPPIVTSPIVTSPMVMSRIVTASVGSPGAGLGMFLVQATRWGAGSAGAQDVRAAADWLAAQLATLSRGSALAQGSLDEAAVAQFWQAVLVDAPLAISSPAPTGDDATPALPGTNPIQQFGGAVLVRIAAPVTSTNLGAFSAWAAGEGSCARFNPLATTEPEPGATAFNTLDDGGHVWNYPSFAVGVDATTAALTNGLYHPVIAAFQADAGVDAVASTVEHSPWGTRHFGSTSYAGKACSNDGPETGGSPTTLPAANSPGSVAATIVARAARYQDIWDQATATTATASPLSPTSGS